MPVMRVLVDGLGGFFIWPAHRPDTQTKGETMETANIELAWVDCSARYNMTWEACKEGVSMIRDYPEFWANEPLSTLVDRVHSKLGHGRAFQK